MGGFSELLYNSKDGTILGRTGKSWFKILLFYTLYYAFLSVLFVFSIRIYQGYLPKDRSRIMTRVDQPGMTVFPHNKMINDKLNLEFSLDEYDPATIKKMKKDGELPIKAKFQRIKQGKSATKTTPMVLDKVLNYEMTYDNIKSAYQKIMVEYLAKQYSQYTENQLKTMEIDQFFDCSQKMKSLENLKDEEEVS